MIKVISTDKSPAAMRALFPGIRANNLLFVSGQVPIDPDTGKVVSGTIKEQTVRCSKI